MLGHVGPGSSARLIAQKDLRASEQKRPDVARDRAIWKTRRPPFMRDHLERLVFIDETSLKTNMTKAGEFLSNLVFEGFGSCGDLVWVCGFNSVFECDASDDFGEVVKAA